MYYIICLLAPPPGSPYETVLMSEGTSDHLSGISVPVPEQKQPEPSVKKFGDA